MTRAKYDWHINGSSMEEAFIHLHNGGQGAPNITIDANHHNPPHKGQSHHASLVPVLLPLNT